jgi:hypothetical protein
MSLFLVSYSLKEKGKDYKLFHKDMKDCGEICTITDTTVIVNSDYEINDVIDRWTDLIGEEDIMLVIDLETLEVNGKNIPECLDTYLGTDDDDFDEDDEEMEEEEEDKK